MMTQASQQLCNLEGNGAYKPVKLCSPAYLSVAWISSLQRVYRRPGR